MERGTGGGPSADANRFAVRVRRDAGAVVLVLSGELDIDTAPQLREELEAQLDEGAERVLVDCAELHFCDSTGLNVLLAARLRAEASGAAIELAALQPPVARMFEVTEARTVFVVHETVDEALAGQ